MAKRRKIRIKDHSPTSRSIEIPSSPDTLRKRLLDKADKLPDHERAVLRLLAAAYEDVATSTFLKCVNDYGVKEGGRPFNRQQMDELLTSFVERGLAIRTDNRTRIAPPVSEPLTRELVANNRITIARDALDLHLPKINPYASHSGRYYKSAEHGIRCIRLALYTRREPDFIIHFTAFLEQFTESPTSGMDMIRAIWWAPYDPAWLDDAPQEIRDLVLRTILCYAEFSGRVIPPETLVLLKRLAFDTEDLPSIDLMRLYAEHLLETGGIDDLAHLAKDRLPLLGKEGIYRGLLFQGVAHVLRGRDAEALEHFDAALARKKTDTGKRKVSFENEQEAFYLLAILRTDDPRLLQAGTTYLESRTRKRYQPQSSMFLDQVFQFRSGSHTSASDLSIYSSFITDKRTPFLSRLVGLLAFFWINGTLPERFVKDIKLVARDAWDLNLTWNAAEMTMLLDRAGLDPEAAALSKAKTFYTQNGLKPLVDIIQKQEPWEAALEAMTRYGRMPLSDPQKESAAESRLVWLVYIWERKDKTITSVQVEPVEQKRTSRGWTKGRKVALKRLALERDSLPFVTPADAKVCGCIESRTAYGTSRYYGARIVYEFNVPKALRALIGHPLLFLQDRLDTPIELVEGKPELRVEEADGELLVRMEPAIDERTEVAVQREGPSRFRVFFLDEGYWNLLKMIGTVGLRIPKSARERLLQAISSVASVVTVHSDIGGGTEAREVEPDRRLYAHVLPLGEGLRVEVLVKPLGATGPVHAPGDGSAGMVAEVDGERLQTKRDLEAEKAAADALLERCPILAREGTGHWQWTFDDAAEALVALSELRDAGDVVEIAWPRGGKIQVTRSISFEGLSLRVERKRNWLAVGGELRIDENRVVNLAKLLEILEGAKGRFVRLEDGEYLALTEALRRRLEEFRAVGDVSGETVQLHPLMAARVDAFSEEAGSIKESATWKRERKKLREAYSMEVAVPSTLQAELREYQREGVAWMARLAHWGAGACLADDMGLGKTVQTLALLLHRAEIGPALVVAPTSVCGNWVEETARFAPTLRVHMFAGSDRQALVENAGAFDLVVCSYGLLQQEADILAGREWATAILDEAQSIKNAATQRSKAAMRLKAGFRAILTGTPIENHLGELWNLFRFVNPGLLGSQERFQTTFAAPIERDRNPEARAKLRGLLQPFLLRRTKAQVLQELPERTEITIRVEPGEEEMVFYEALRRKCIEDVESNDEGSGGNQFKIFAAIMKLRRACCHPALVQPGLTTTSAKHEAFGEILDELLENRHKALVFSQFVDHLAILRKHLDEKGVSYQYLDGSTPQKERDKRVKAFQAGEGEIFLISLKAGGLGLNLTAADYVIHMDPWWNPAVEDQAADRAHRIGQTRPVTIYRLVAKGTIEEKIVELHRDKRDLADSLLEGAEGGARLSADDLLRLLREG